MNVRTFVEAFELDLVGAAWMYSEYSDYSARNRNELLYCPGKPEWISRDCPDITPCDESLLPGNLDDCLEVIK